MGYKIVFFDVDGTLIDNKTKEIPLTAKLSILELQKNGIIVVAATGRSYGLSKNLRQKLGIENFINFSGGYARTENEELLKFPISSNLVHELYVKSIELGDFLVGFGVSDMFSNGLSKEIALPILNKIDCFVFPSTKIEFIEEVMSLCLILDKGNIEMYENLVPELQFYQWGIDTPNAYNIELKNTNKASGVKAFLEYFKIDKKDAIAFGDGGNDIEMLKSVGLGIAMENAQEQLKHNADFITKAAHQNGIEYALKKFELI